MKGVDGFDATVEFEFDFFFFEEGFNFFLDLS